MKKIMKLFVFVAAAAMTLASCQKNEVKPAAPQDVEYTFLLGSENDVDSKATIGENNVVWETGDRLGTFTTSSTPSNNKYSIITPGEPASFSVYASGGLAVGNMLYFYYPYNEDAGTDKTAVTLSIPEEQDGKDDMPMASLPFEVTTKSTENQTPYDGQINLVNLAAIAEFNVFSSVEDYQSELVESVEFTVDGETALAGSFTFNLTTVDYSDKSTLVIEGYAEKSVVASITPATFGASSDDAAKVNMVVAPGTYTGTVVVETDKASYTFSVTNAKEFVRSAVKPLAVDLAKGERVEKTVEPEPEGVVTATLTFDDKAKRTEYSTSIQVWEENGIKLTNAKESATTNVGDYANPARFYKNSTITIEAPGYITKIEFNSVTTSDKLGFLKELLPNASVNDNVVTEVYDGLSASVSYSLTTGQIQLNSITVTYTLGGETPEPEEPEVDRPVINVESTSIEVEAIGGDIKIPVTINNSVQEIDPTAAVNVDWISITTPTTKSSSISGYFNFTVEENTSAYSREGVITLSYEGAESVNVTVIQAGKPAADDPTRVTDVLNLAFTSMSGTTYGNWSAVGASGAMYDGNSAGGNDAIQLRSTNSAGIVTTASGGYAKKVVISWNSNTADERTLQVYGYNTAYTATSNLYESSTQGIKLGEIGRTSTELLIAGNYQYIGLRSKSGAMYLDEIQITWSSIPLPLESIAVSGEKTEYYVGEAFVAPTVYATYTGGSSSVVSGAQFSGYDMSVEGEQTVVVSYTQEGVTKETTYTINVNAKPELLSIALSGQTTNYTVGDPFSFTGTVTATYSNGTTSTVTPTDVSNPDMTTAGDKEVTVTYTEDGVTVSQSYTITVAEKVVEPEEPETPVEPETPKAWTLVTDASTLAAGDQIVIVAKDYNYAMSTTQNKNNRGQIAITKSSNTVTINADVQVITLEAGTVTGTFAFNVGSQYLYAASKSENYLKSGTKNDNAAWKIEIASTGVATIKAQGTNTKNWMRYNKSSSLFSCYSSGQTDICIYKYL